MEETIDEGFEIVPVKIGSSVEFEEKGFLDFNVGVAFQLMVDIAGPMSFEAQRVRNWIRYRDKNVNGLFIDFPWFLFFPTSPSMMTSYRIPYLAGSYIQYRSFAWCSSCTLNMICLWHSSITRIAHHHRPGHHQQHIGHPKCDTHHFSPLYLLRWNVKMVQKWP